MKRFSFSVVILLCSFSSLLYAQKSSITCRQIPALIGMLEKYQYRPITINVTVSDSIRLQYYEKLDPNRLFFTQRDIFFLNSFPVDFSDATTDEACKFISATTSLYRKKLLHADSLISQIIANALNLNEKDSLLLIKKENYWFAENDIQLKKRWQEWIKYQVLFNIFQSLDSTVDLQKVNRTVLLANESTSRIKTGKTEKQKITRILDDPQGFDNIVAAGLLKTIASRYDPHTEFFSSDEKKQFESAISTSSYLFGLSFVENDDGLIVIDRLIPGSAAWKSNELHKGDQLMQLKFTDGKPRDVSNADYEEVMSLMASSSDEAEFTIKKPNGQLKTVSLTKEKTEDDEALLKSYILKGKNTIGYISLPDFYTDVTRQTSKGCANDMAKEILKLKKENISGLIIDLRYNGGGSMEEAVDLAGIFINEGPICAINDKQNKTFILKDMNRGTIYDGPLLVMINGLSASASELLACALQDYHRAVLVGSPTFGKSTAQQILPMDTAITPENIISGKIPPDIPFLKITIGKFYRVTGKSHQLKGVIPDISLPPFFYELGYKESLLPYALLQDSVSKKIYYQPLPLLPISELALKSSERVAGDKYFTFIKHLGDSIKVKQNTNSYYPLDIDKFRNQRIRLNAFYDKADSIFSRPSADFVATNNLFDLDVMKMNAYYREINSSYLEKIQNDIYIEECYRVMNDLINSNLK